jgi:hypothetical protein
MTIATLSFRWLDEAVVNLPFPVEDCCECKEY